MGKTDKYRKVDPKKYADGFIRAFGICKHGTCPFRKQCPRNGAEGREEVDPILCMLNGYRYYNGEHEQLTGDKNERI